MLRLLRTCSRLAYRVRGLARLAEVHRRWWARSARTVWIDDFDGDLRFRCELGEHMGSQIYWRGSYSWPLLRHLDSRLAPDMVFIDAGANHGELTLFAAKRLVHGRVIAFEPAPEIHARLAANLAANPAARAELVPMGLADAAGTAVLHTTSVRYEDGTEHHGLPSLYRVDAHFAPVAEIELTTLDLYLDAHPTERLDWLKVDVEGAELAVLRGGAGSIARFGPRILIEINEETARAAGGSAREVLAWLHAAGYATYELDDRGRASPLALSELRAFHNVLATPPGVAPDALGGTTLSGRSLSNALATALDLGCRLACSIAVARILGTAGAGAVAYGLWLADLAVVCAGIGLPTALVRFAAERTGDAAAQRALGRHTARATFALGLVGAAGVYAYVADHPPAARALIAGLVVLRALDAVLRAWWTGTQRFDLLSRFNALAAPVWLALVATGAWMWSVEGALAGYAAAALVPAALACGLALRRAVRLEPELFRRVWRHAGFVWLSAVVTALIWGRFELYFLRHARGEQEAGLYAAGLTLAGLATSGPLMFAGALMPHFSERIAAGDPGAVRATYAAATRLLALSLFPACLATAAIVPALIPALYGEAFRGAIPAAAILVAGSSMAATSVGSSLLLGSDRAHVIAFFGIALTIAAVLLHGHVVPIWGAEGAAVGRGVLQLAGAALGATYIARVLGCPVPLAALARTLLAAAIAGLAAHGVVRAGTGHSWTIAPALLAAVLVYALAGRALGILDPADRAYLERALAHFPPRAAGLARAMLDRVSRRPA